MVFRLGDRRVIGKGLIIEGTLELDHGGQTGGHKLMITANTCTLLSMYQVLFQALYIY